MTVFAGVRKINTLTSILCELGSDISTNNGTFVVSSPASSGFNRFASKGTNISFVDGTTPSPDTSVLTGIGNISGDSAILRVNAIQAAINTGDQGAGNFGNYPLFVGRRGGTSLPFNGHLYSLIIRGAQSTDAQIVSAETYVNSKTGAY
jgi:hypothetical protein